MRKINRKRQNSEIDLKKMLWPIFFELIMTGIIGNINQMILNEFSPIAVASTTAASQFLTLTNNMYTIFSVGQSILVALAWGAGNDREGVRILLSSLFANLCFSIVLSLTGTALIPNVTVWLNMPTELRQMGADYLKVMISCSVFQAMTVTLSAALRAMGKMKEVMLGNLLINGSCVGMNFLILICVPEQVQVVGMYALAGVFSQIFGGVFFYAVLRADKRAGRLIRRGGISLKEFKAGLWNNVRHIIRLGFPGGMEGIIYLISQTAVMSLIGILGTQALTVKGYTGNLVTYMALPANAVPLAAATLIGMAAGQHRSDRIHEVFNRCLKISLILTGLICAVCLLGGRVFLMVYTKDSEILNQCMRILVIDCILELSRCFAALLVVGLKGVGDVRLPFIMVIIASGLNIGISWYFGIVLGFGLPGIWYGYVADLVFRSIIGMYRWNNYRKNRDYPIWNET